MNVSALPVLGDDPVPSRPSDGWVHPVVEIVVPVHNEAHVLEASIRTLHGYLAGHLPWAWQVTIADNASSDATYPIARRLERELPRVRVLHLDRKGRGLALKTVWAASDADVVAYMRSSTDGPVPSAAPGWSVTDVMLHLAQTEEAVVNTTRPQAGSAVTAEAADGTGPSVDERMRSTTWRRVL